MKKLLTISSIISLAVIGVVFGVQKASANSSFVLANTPTASATTTDFFMKAGTATTTFTGPDSYANGQNRLTDSTALMVQFLASSTSSVLNITAQYSQDGIDWYDNNLLTNATSTITDISAPISFRWTASGTATSSKIITIQTPTRYFRTVFSMTGAAGGVWAQYVPKREAIQ